MLIVFDDFVFWYLRGFLCFICDGFIFTFFYCIVILLGDGELGFLVKLFDGLYLWEEGLRRIFYFFFCLYIV